VNNIAFPLWGKAKRSTCAIIAFPLWGKVAPEEPDEGHHV